MNSLAMTISPGAYPFTYASTTYETPCARKCKSCKCKECRSCSCKDCKIERLEARVAELEKENVNG